MLTVVNKSILFYDDDNDGGDINAAQYLLVVQTYADCDKHRVLSLTFACNVCEQKLLAVDARPSIPRLARTAAIRASPPKTVSRTPAVVMTIPSTTSNGAFSTQSVS